jgi:hypothetical protein
MLIVDAQVHVWSAGPPANRAPVGQRRSPDVEYGSEPDAGAEVLGVGRDGDQGLGGDFEQQVIDDRLVLIGNVGDRSRQGKDDMEIGHGQEFGPAVGQPLDGSGGFRGRTSLVCCGFDQEGS